MVGELVERFVLVGQFVEWLELERLLVVGELLERFVLVGQLVEWLELERQQLVGWVMARSKLGLTRKERGW